VTDERWQLAYAIYEGAVPLAESSRRQYVEGAAPDEEIASRVLMMLDELESATASHAVAERVCSTDAGGGRWLPPGARLGPYEIHSRIGEGGMGVVYRAYDPRLDRKVAIKLLWPEMAADPKARERLRREARAAAALDHPYICKIFEIGEDGDALFLVMEFIAGITLHRHLQEGRMPLSDALRVAGEIAEALQEAHARGFLHRDLKPSNIMLTEHGHVKMLDFGLAKRIADRRLSGNYPPSPDSGVTQPTATGTLLGTPDYMSPEQVKGLALDVRSDVFSFGAILAEMISGRNPFRKPSMAETLSAVLRDSPDFGGEIPGGTTVRGLVVMARRMLAKDVAERYASIADLRADLARLAASSESAAAMISGQQRTERVPPIGRSAELKQLAQQLEEALAGRGSLVLVGGEPGIGKTHLSWALLDAARARGAFAIAGQCHEMEGSPPYVPFVEMLEHTARSLPLDTFRHVLGDDAPEVARLMPELRQMFPDIPRSLALPAEQQRRFFFNACRAFLQRLARLTPIVAVFEDLQWADEATLLLVQHLAQSVAGMPMFIIGTYRDVDLEVGRPCARLLESLVRQKLGTRILLRRLPAGGVAEMLAALSAQQPPRSLARVLFEKTDGNPFFVEEVFRHLAEEGKLFDERGNFSPGLQVDQLQAPDGVRLVLGRRLERLSEEARRVLTTAAVIGRAFSLDLLEELEKSRPDAALDAVEEGIRAHLVETEGKARETRYRFVHELLRQTLSETLSLPRRQRLHARIAGVMERIYAAKVDAHVSALAHHLYQAGSLVDQEKTIHFLLEAARQASGAAAHEEALQHLDNAISLLDEERTARAADLLARRAGALSSLSRHREAVQEYERALTLFDSLGDQARFVEISIRLHILHVWATEFQEVKSIIDRLDQRAEGSSAALRCSVLAMQAHRASTFGDIDQSLDLLDKLQKIPENELPRSVLGFAAEQEMFTRYGAGQLHLCEAAARKASRIYEQSGDVWSMAGVEVGLLWPPLLCGKPAETGRRVLEAISRATRIGNDVAKSVELWILAGVHIAEGRLESAEQTAREALALMESCHFGWAFVAEFCLGGILLYRGQTEEAVGLLTKAAATSTPVFRGLAEGLRAWSLTAAGMDGAQDARTGVMRFLPCPGTSRSVGAWNAVLGLTEAQCLSGHRQEAGRLLVEAEKIAGEWDCSHAGFPVRTAAGIAAACAGDWMRADDHHRAAIERMDATPYVTAQPIARYWYADMLAERGGANDIGAAKTMLKESIAASDRIGLALYARLARQRLAGIS
jgi:serine/threonine protein kinase/tetratricopeptide (TPR) repeat protein